MKINSTIYINKKMGRGSRMKLPHDVISSSSNRLCLECCSPAESISALPVKIKLSFRSTRLYAFFTAFIVETNTPGFEIVHRCQFMGLHGIQNGLLRFTNVKVPRENIVLGEGQGLKLALVTLNTGRLTVPAASTGIAKWALSVSRKWSTKRVQWGGPIGEHESIALKLGYFASHIFAMDAVSWLTAAMADDEHKDIRLEAAMAKHFCTLHAWDVVDQTLQIRGGQGYEQSTSLKARGMEAYPVERVLRDFRINLIIEGTTEIMRLFIAREALDPHLGRTQDLLSPKTSLNQKFKAFCSAGLYYATWYPGLWLPTIVAGKTAHLPSPLNQHMRYVQNTSKRLARHMFHLMLKFQTKLATKQSVLNRVVDIGTDLFVMSAVCSYADSLLKLKNGKENAIELADLFCRDAKIRIETLLKENTNNNDRQNLSVAKKLLKDEFLWLENDIIT